jgi:diguanylate cyclase (GGDEF)-like protein
LAEAGLRLRQGGCEAAILLQDRGDAAAIARLQARAPDLPILAIADDHDPDFARRAIAAGAQEALALASIKPGDLARMIAIAIERKRFERRRLRFAREDEETGLANRALLEERFSRAMARADRQATLVGLVAIDLDEIDGLALAHGERAAARLLPQAAARLAAETRKTDTLARTRETGFTLLLEGLPTVNDITALVDRLPKALASPFSLDGRDVRVTASVGVAICPFHGRDFQSAHAMAEAAMTDVASISGDGLLMPPLPAVARRFDAPTAA